MAYTIVDQRLQKDRRNVVFRQTPHGGARLKPRFLILHYTAGGSFESTVRWFQNPQAKASAHVVIGQKGEVCQMQDFDKTCWHAGVSQWKTAKGLNASAIGIELDNAGLLRKTPKGGWMTWFGAPVEAKDVMVAPHRRGGAVCGWQVYTKAQIETCHAIVKALHAHFKFEDILGHDDISWPRKTDPGPAFPLSEMKALAKPGV